MLGVPGVVVLGLGLFGVVESIRTGHQDAQHGGGMLFVAGSLVALIGLVLVVLAVVAHPRRGADRRHT